MIGKLGLLQRPLAPNAPRLRQGAFLERRAPDRVMRDGIAIAPGMYGNDVHENCTLVAYANCARTEMLVHQSVDLPITTDHVLARFRRMGWDPADPATDVGQYMDVVMNDALRVGWDIGQQSLLTGLWAGIEPDDLNALRLVIAGPGAVCLSLNLSKSDVLTDPWTMRPPASAGDDTPGSGGGHEVVAHAYSGTSDDDVLLIQSWGAIRPAPWPWVRSRLTQAFMITFRQALGMGIDPEQLAADNYAQLGEVG